MLKSAKPLPREFLLVAACCRWPLTDEAQAAIRAQAAGVIDWHYFMRIVRRQRVVGLAHNALSAAQVELPALIADQLVSGAHQVAKRNLALAAETMRLQRAFEVGGIVTIGLKGAALAQFAYGTLTIKHSKDIDVLLPRERALDALAIAEREGYALRQPARWLSDRQRAAALRYGAEFALQNRARKIELELRWRLTENPLLLAAGEPWSQARDVALSDSLTIRTLDDDLLFAYLCAHGAGHGWSRLKWLADLNALLASKGDAEIERLYRSAQAKGAGICAGQALLLCRRLLQRPLPRTLAREMQGSMRLQLLVATAVDAMTGPDCATELESRPFGSTRVSLMQFLLGRSGRYLAAQCRIFSVRLGDAMQLTLPPALAFLYPVLRVPLWLWRRAKWAWSHD